MPGVDGDKSKEEIIASVGIKREEPDDRDGDEEKVKVKLERCCPFLDLPPFGLPACLPACLPSSLVFLPPALPCCMLPCLIIRSWLSIQDWG